MHNTLHLVSSLIVFALFSQAADAHDRFRQRGYGYGNNTVVVTPARQAGYGHYYAPPVTVIQTYPGVGARCDNRLLPRNAATQLLLPQSHYTHGYLPPSHYGAPQGYAVPQGYYGQGFRDGYRAGRINSGGINIRFD